MGTSENTQDSDILMQQVFSNTQLNLAADDLAFFASLGPILKSFDVGQKLEFRSRVLREAMDIRNYNRSNSSNSSYSNDARYASSYNCQIPAYPEYETNNANHGYSGNQTARL
ncbi:hypothetical protein ACJJTC_016784 [Scirpophaga incertulas]